MGSELTPKSLLVCWFVHCWLNLCQDHKRAAVLRSQIWVLTDLIAGVR